MSIDDEVTESPSDPVDPPSSSEWYSPETVIEKHSFIRKGLLLKRGSHKEDRYVQRCDTVRANLTLIFLTAKLMFFHLQLCLLVFYENWLFAEHNTEPNMQLSVHE